MDFIIFDFDGPGRTRGAGWGTPVSGGGAGFWPLAGGGLFAGSC